MGIINDENLPRWDNEGIDPGETKKTDGWQKEEKPPANWFNWLFNKIYDALARLNIVNLSDVLGNGNLAGDRRIRQIKPAIDDGDAVQKRQNDYSKTSIRQMDSDTLVTPLIGPNTNRARRIFNAHSAYPEQVEQEGISLGDKTLSITGRPLQMADNFELDILSNGGELDFVCDYNIPQGKTLTITAVGGAVTVRFRSVFGYDAGTSGNGEIIANDDVTVIYERAENMTFTESGGTVQNALWYTKEVRKFDLENMAGRTIRGNLLGSNGIEDIPRNDVLTFISRDNAGSPYESTRDFDYCFRWGPDAIHNDVIDPAGDIGQSTNPIDMTGGTRTVHGRNIVYDANHSWHLNVDSGWSGLFIMTNIDVASGAKLTINKSGDGELDIYVKAFIGAGEIEVVGDDVSVEYERLESGVTLTPQSSFSNVFWFSNTPEIDNGEMADMQARTLKGNATDEEGEPQDIPLADNQVLKRDGDTLVSGFVENKNLGDAGPYTTKVRDSGTPGKPEDKTINTYSHLGREGGLLKSVPNDAPTIGRVGVSTENELIAHFWREDPADKRNRQYVVVNKEQNQDQSWFVGDSGDPVANARGAGRPVLFADSGETITITINRKTGAATTYGEIYLNMDLRINGGTLIFDTSDFDSSDRLFIYVNEISGSGGTLQVNSGIRVWAEQCSYDIDVSGSGDFEVIPFVSRPSYYALQISTDSDGLVEIGARPQYNYISVDATNHDNGVIFLYIDSARCPDGTQCQFFVRNNSGVELSVGLVLNVGTGELERLGTTTIGVDNYTVVSCVLTEDFSKDGQTWGGVASFLPGA